MAVCSKCGTQLVDGAKFCPACGASVSAGAAGENKGFEETFKNLNNTEDSTGSFDQGDIAKNKGMAILSYISLLVLIPLFAAKDSPFARYHANQGLVLFLAEVAFSIARIIVVAILGIISYRLSSAIDTILGICTLVFLAVSILGIVNAANGVAKELPVIGKIKILK